MRVSNEILPLGMDMLSLQFSAKILGIGCVSIWCASARRFLFRARLTEVLKFVLSLGAQITRTGTYARIHTHMQARARTPYYHCTLTKSKEDVHIQ